MMNIFFDSWESLFRTFIITILAYITMVLMLRVSGKRTLSKMNAFDFVVTIALGSALANVSLNKNVALIDGALAFSLLISMQLIITWLSVRMKGIKRLVTTEPSLLLYRGELFHEKLKKERITIEEIYLAAREEGVTDLQDIDAIILETTGNVTVIPKLSSLQSEGMKDVRKPQRLKDL